jgi:hypothetical protein
MGHEGLKMGARAEVRIPCASIADAKELALRLRADEYTVARRFRTVIARTATREEGEHLAVRLQIEPRSTRWRSSDSGSTSTLASVAGLFAAGTRLFS